MARRNSGNDATINGMFHESLSDLSDRGEQGGGMSANEVIFEANSGSMIVFSTWKKSGLLEPFSRRRNRLVLSPTVSWARFEAAVAVITTRGFGYVG